METLQAANLDQFIIRKADQPGCDDVDEAGFKNLAALVPTLPENPLYHFEANKKDPPSIDSDLDFFDCITCNKCLPVCPNAANFFLPIGEMDVGTNNFKMEDGRFVAVAGTGFELKKKAQIANLADFCNECGECDPYCPERGGPFIQKPRFFFSRETYERYADYDGFYLPDSFTLKGRYQGKPYMLSYDPVSKRHLWNSEEVEFELDSDNQLVSGTALNEIGEESVINMDAYYAMKALLHGLVDHPKAYASIMLREK
jgi:putative selenate reductase